METTEGRKWWRPAVTKETRGSIKGSFGNCCPLFQQQKRQRWHIDLTNAESAGRGQCGINEGRWEDHVSKSNIQEDIKLPITSGLSYFGAFRRIDRVSEVVIDTAKEIINLFDLAGLCGHIDIGLYIGPIKDERFGASTWIPIERNETFLISDRWIYIIRRFDVWDNKCWGSALISHSSLFTHPWS